MTSTSNVRPARCACESAYCSAHGGDLTGRYPTADPCTNVADGPEEPWVGRICRQCAAVNGWERASDADSDPAERTIEWYRQS